MVIIGLFTLLIASVVSTGEGEMSTTEIEYCCNIVSNMSDCHSACLKFASKCPPAVQNKTEYLADYCSEIPSTLDVCLSNTNLSSEYSQSKPTPSQQLVACCSTSGSQACEDVCIEQIYIGLLDDAAIVAVIEECGPPISVFPPADPIWSCFFDFAADTTQTTTTEINTDESDDECTDDEVTEPTLTITYADWPRLECCTHANSTECKKACQREYSGNRVQGTWDKINLDCIYQPNEDKLAICLADVIDQCSPTCTGLEFCQNFNNRPLQLFRNCNDQADNEAEQKYNEWKNGLIQLPLISIQIKDASTCLPELWQAAACAIYTQPCDPYTHSSLLCKDECLRLMNACISDSESKTPEEICDIISPSHLQDRCISIGQFTEPASLQSLTNIIHSPCQTDHCQDGYHCIINHNCIGNEDRVCTPYMCVEEILLGKTPSMSVPGTDTVHVTTLPETGQRCYGFIHKEDNEFGQQTSALSSEYCRNLEQCSFDGKLYDHGAVFNRSDGCNFCTCYHGDLLCTQHSCIEATVVHLGPTPLLSCDCPTLYAPVCTMTGRTLPNWCIAKCLGYSFHQYKIGSCSSSDPCDDSLCPTGTRCVSQRHICLSDNNTVTDCPQYTCENYLSCSKFTSPICDTDGSQHESLCSIFFTSKQIDYFGYCQKECNSDRSQKVCGVNGETFQTKCHALQFGVAIDYIGDCHEIPSGSHGCDLIKCPGEQYLSSTESCDGPIPPGACCKQCGGLVNAIIDHKGLNYSSNSMNATSINSTNILERMRLHLEMLECRLDGYLAIDNTFVFLLMPTNYSSFLNVEICNMESVRLSTLINTRSPILATDPFLYFLVAATPSLAKVQSVPPFVTEAYTEHNGCGRATPLLFTFILMLLLNCVLN